ncbi:MAG: hypothetical protein ACXVFZ_01515 [Blastococcus sp.]
MVVISPEQRTEWTRLTDRLSAEYPSYDVTIPQGGALKVTDESETTSLVSLLRLHDGGQEC